MGVFFWLESCQIVLKIEKKSSSPNSKSPVNSNQEWTQVIHIT